MCICALICGYAQIVVGMYRMDEFTHEGILEDDIDVRHRAYMMTEKKKVIKKPNSHVILLCLN
jgi:hypothetical protein